MNDENVMSLRDDGLSSKQSPFKQKYLIERIFPFNWRLLCPDKSIRDSIGEIALLATT